MPLSIQVPWSCKNLSDIHDSDRRKFPDLNVFSVVNNPAMWKSAKWVGCDVCWDEGLCVEREVEQ